MRESFDQGSSLPFSEAAAKAAEALLIHDKHSVYDRTILHLPNFFDVFWLAVLKVFNDSWVLNVGNERAPRGTTARQTQDWPRKQPL